MNSDQIRSTDELWGEQMGDTVLQPGRALAFWLKEIALQLCELKEAGIYTAEERGPKRGPAPVPEPTPFCTDCHKPVGSQHRPSCHRQGLVTSASVYVRPVSE